MQLAAHDLGFAFPGQPVFKHVNLRAQDGTRLGIVGENGSGKSTLLRVLVGALAPTSGDVRRQGSFSLVEQEFDVAAHATIGDAVDSALADVRAAAEHVATEAAQVANATTADTEPNQHRLADLIAQAERLAAWDVDRRVDEALTRLGAPRERDRLLTTLSVGERYRVRLACHLAERADFLLLDEPTNHLDDDAIAYLTETIRNWPGGVVLVTHDRALLDDVATGILDLDPSMDGKPTFYRGMGYLQYRAAKDESLATWRRRYVREQKRAARLALTLDSSYEGLSDEWRPPKGSQKNRRGTRARQHVKAADRLLEQLKAAAVEIPVPPLQLAFPVLPDVISSGAAQPLIELHSPLVLGDDSGLGKATYEPSRPQVRLDLPNETISISPGGRLLVVGPNGSGKSTLLGMLAGTLARGSRTIAPGLRIGVLNQENVEAEGDAGVARLHWNADPSAGRFREPFRAAQAQPATGKAQPPAYGPRTSPTGFDVAANDVRSLLHEGLLDPNWVVPIASLGLLSEHDLDRPSAELSAGQRRRLALARALLAGPHLLLFDEPTNHLSLDLIEELAAALQTTNAAVVVATHDRRLQADFADWPTLRL